MKCRGRLVVDRVIGRESGVDMTDPTAAAVYTVHSGYYYCYYYYLYKDTAR